MPGVSSGCKSEALGNGQLNSARANSAIAVCVQEEVPEEAVRPRRRGRRPQDEVADLIEVRLEAAPKT